MEASVFLSYSRADGAIARAVAESLGRAGIGVWWDARLRAGDAYDEVTEAALRQARAVLVLWSGRSVASRWVRSEAAIAQRAGTLMPVMIEPCERPVMFELVQATDLSGWTGDDADPAWQSLLADVRRRVAPEDAAGHTPVAAPVQAAAGSPPGRLPPTLAILPVRELGEAARYLLAPGIAAELETAFGRFNDFRLAALREGGTAADYSVEATVRHGGERLKVTVGLNDARAGVRIWSCSFGECVASLADPEEFIAETVAGAVDLALYDHRQRVALQALGAGDPAADLLMAAEARRAEYNHEAAHEALAIVTRLMERSADFAPALALGGALHATIAMNGWASDPETHRAAAVALAGRAIRLAPGDEHVLVNAAHALLNAGRPVAEAESLLLRAHSMNPMRLLTRYWLALVDNELGRVREALDRIGQVVRLNPRAGILPFALLAQGHAMFGLGRHDEAAAALSEAVRIRPDYPPAHLFLVASLAAAGRLAEALAARPRLEALGGKARALSYVSNREQRRRVHRALAMLDCEPSLQSAG